LIRLLFIFPSRRRAVSPAAVLIFIRRAGSAPSEHTFILLHLSSHVKQKNSAYSADEALKRAGEVSGAPVFCGERLIFEENESAELFFYAPSAVMLTESHDSANSVIL